MIKQLKFLSQNLLKDNYKAWSSKERKLQPKKLDYHEECNWTNPKKRGGGLEK